jgi:hypothetical protein
LIARIITSKAAVNDLELHSIDIEQAFLQTDKLMEGVNDELDGQVDGWSKIQWYFINPPPGSPGDNLVTRTLCMKCCDLYTEIPRRQEPYIKLWMPFSRAKVLIP